MIYTELVAGQANGLSASYQAFKADMADAEFILWANSRPEPLEHRGMYIDLQGLNVRCKPTAVQNSRLSRQFGTFHWKRGVGDALDLFSAENLFQLESFVKMMEVE